MEEALVTAQAIINVTQSQAIAWFISLKEHPERYRFTTHGGFTFTHGNFGSPGARFETRERFYGLSTILRFELTDVQPTRFRFRLRHLPIWGVFDVEEQTIAVRRGTNVSLSVGGTTAIGRAIVRFPVVRAAIQRQIHGEVDNIKASMENLFDSPTQAQTRGHDNGNFEENT